LHKHPLQISQIADDLQMRKIITPANLCDLEKESCFLNRKKKTADYLYVF